MENPEEKRYHVEGSPAESALSGVVSGETEGREWSAEQDKAAMEKRLEKERGDENIIATLEGLWQRYAHDEDIESAIYTASIITNPSKRLEMTIDNLLELSERLRKNHDIENDSRVTRISIIVNKLRELL